MEISAIKEARKSESLVGTGGISRPTSPEQIHEETAATITENLKAAGHPPQENVKVDQTFKPTPDLRKIGVEPSEGEPSAKDMLRIVTEELEHEGGNYRVVTGKGADAVGFIKGRQSRMANFFNKFRKKAA